MPHNARKRPADPAADQECRRPFRTTCTRQNVLSSTHRTPIRSYNHGSLTPKSIRWRPSNLTVSPSSSSATRLPPASVRHTPDESFAQKPATYKPAIRHRPHPDSKLCENFHWVPYPLGLMPRTSWEFFHKWRGFQQDSIFCCPKCRAPRACTPHKRKLFLVAERLCWEEGHVSTKDKELNQELLWEVNFELGILDPAVQDPEPANGGRKSQANMFYPYQSKFGMEQALNLIFLSDNLTETNFSFWILMQQGLQYMLDAEAEKQSPTEAFHSTPERPSKPQLQHQNQSCGRTPDEIEVVDLTISPDHTPRKPQHKNRSRGRTPDEIEVVDLTISPCHTPRKPLRELERNIPTPPSSVKLTGRAGTDIFSRIPLARSGHEQKEHIPPFQPNAVRDVCDKIPATSYPTLQQFYSLLDQIERTSLVSAFFLEAYAEHLHSDRCKDCWFKEMIEPERP